MDQSRSYFNAPRSKSCIPFWVRVRNTLAMETWRERARARLKEMNLTQEWLAEQFDMTPAGVQKWLAGTRQPTLEDINRIADHLKSPQTWLTHGIEPADTLDGLPAASRNALRTLIQLERLGALPHTLWTAIEAMTSTVAPSQVTQIKSETDITPRDGTQG